MPRREIHQQPLEELGVSIKANGVIQTIVVRPLPASAVGEPRNCEVLRTFRSSSDRFLAKKRWRSRSSRIFNATC